jgi:rod shape-determining protein MreC
MQTSRDDFIIAIRSAFLKKGNQQRFSLLSLILFSLIFLILGNFNFKIINYTKNIIKDISYMSSFITSVPENIISKSYNKTSDHFEFYKKYEKIKNELQELKSKDLSKKIITFENIELKKLIDDYFIEDRQTYAKVLIDKESPFLRSVVINKGSKNDVKVGMIAYDDIYLIGKIVEVNYLTSRVLLISDINSKVPVTIQPLNTQAIMSGLGEQVGTLQYIKDEKLNNKNNEELIVVTSGFGKLFKSGIPIGNIASKNLSNSDEIIVNFYSDLSQLKYVRILSYIKEDENLDKTDKKIFKTNSAPFFEINDYEKEIKVFKKQRVINEEIRVKLERENAILKERFINTKKELEDEKQKIKKVYIKSEDTIFLELNLLYGHKCRKTFFHNKLFKINTIEYRTCVLNKGLIKKN